MTPNESDTTESLARPLTKTVLATAETPEERELANKRAELATLEAELAERELDLATLRAETSAFEARYFWTVGRLFSELDQLRAQETAAEARRNPDNPESQRKAAEARAYADASAEAVSDAIVSAVAEFRPSDDLKRLYRQIAKLIHPDLTTSEAERTRRHRIMAEANRAYRQGDEATLRALMNDWRVSPESVPGEGVAAELVRTIRKIHQAQVRLAVIASDIATLKESELFALKLKADESTKKGHDLLAQMADQLIAEISELRDSIQAARTHQLPQQLDQRQ